MKKSITCLLPLLLASLLTGCASDYVARTRDVRLAYETYDHERAVALLDKDAKDAEVDKLLLLLDKGMVLHAAGKYPESIEVLDKADKLSQQLDTVSVSEEAAALITNERNKAYRGEDFEKLMITALQAINYAELGKDEDALVEVRRVNERILKMVSDEKKPYEQLAIARYLGGVLYEDQGDLDAAVIDYLAAGKLQPNLGALAEPLLRLAKKTGRDDAYEELKAKYPKVEHFPLRPGDGQVVVVIEAGRAPEKEESQVERGHSGAIQMFAVPRFRTRGSGGQATVKAADQAVETVTVTSIDQVAKVHLDDRIGRMVAKSLAGTAVKAGLAAGAGALAKNEAVGALAFALLSLNTQADLRSWLSLPAEFQLARLRLPAGTQKITVESGGKSFERTVEVKAKRISVVAIRRY